MFRRRMLVALSLVALACGSGGTEPVLLLATTTSVRDSGLMDTLLPVFEERTGIHVRVVAVGTGAALRMGSSGDADALITHSPLGEEALVDSGAAASRTPFMENHFVIAGPPGDPAGVRDADSPQESYRRMAAAGVAYVSRGDDSGTHRRERALLEAAGLAGHESWPGFASTGSGMGLTLQVAGERRAYVLSDAGTFHAFRERTGLVALSRPAPALRNVYSVLRIAPERFDGIHAEEARRFEAFLTDLESQRLIGSFGVERYGTPLFRPLLAVASE